MGAACYVRIGLKGACTHTGFLPESYPAPVVEFFTRSGITAGGGQFDSERCIGKFFYTLFEELKSHDSNVFNHFRMSVSTFEFLVMCFSDRIKAKILH